ncbi:unnamed protein product [Phytophthora fragariaefolia]|uniref:Unnamed protein product n=1 Tax=Phytophthora fragariaefolia TaxID=1490495 RepID=A0A9W6X9P9_9STRA|nr:unnamed protein product [Phytophthora fragariaefolia]
MCTTVGRARIKVTLAGSLVYYFDAWVSAQSGQTAILGMDFMVPAEIRLDLADGSLCHPDEVKIQLSGRRQLCSANSQLITLDQHLEVPEAEAIEVPIRSGPSPNPKLWVTRGPSWHRTRFLVFRGSSRSDRVGEQICYQEGGDLFAEDVEQHMALLPEVVSTTDEVTIEDIQAGDPEFNTPVEIDRLCRIIWRRKHLLIGKGNALPPAALGAVCDIDVGGAAPVAQRVRPVAPQFREKLSQLIKGLLSSKIIQPSTSPWASPIVIIIKKNGVDIRLCIDYRLVNNLTRLMVYPMPLINDLLEDLDKLLWYCSLDMASGFWVSARARYYSAKREGSEHVCDYPNRLNDHARNTGVQFEKGGRESKEHVNRFLESCGDRGLERRLCHLRVKDIHDLEDIINDILKSEERSSTRETSAYLSRGRDRSHGRDEGRAETSRDGYRRDRHDRHGRGYGGRMDDSCHPPRISLAEASLSEMMAELQVRESKYGRSERSKSRDMRRSLEDSSSEDEEDRSTDDNQSGSDYADPYYSDEHDRHVAAANDALSAELRQSGRTAGLRTAAAAGTSLTEGSTATPATKALTDVAVSMNRVQHAGELTIPSTTVSSVPSLQRRFKLSSAPNETGLVPIGLPQLAFPPVDADCVYAFVGESKWLKTQRREEVNEVNTTEIEKERSGSFGGGESDERRNDVWNGGSSAGLVSSVTQKTWHDYQPENVIKLLSGERLGWWSAQKFDKRVRMRALVQGAVNAARTRIPLDTGANVSVISERFAK